jgi:hypothetical protein
MTDTPFTPPTVGGNVSKSLALLSNQALNGDHHVIQVHKCGAVGWGWGWGTRAQRKGPEARQQWQRVGAGPFNADVGEIRQGMCAHGSLLGMQPTQGHYTYLCVLSN